MQDDGEPDGQKPDNYYILGDSNSVVDFRERPDKADLKLLARIPTCAIFHKLTTGRGVPHAFTSALMFSFSSKLHISLSCVHIEFVRQWPALPRLVVSIVLLSYSQDPNVHVNYRSFSRSACCTFLGYRQQIVTSSPRSAPCRVCIFLRLKYYVSNFLLGFYGVTYYLGFRDDHDVQVSCWVGVLAGVELTDFFRSMKS